MVVTAVELDNPQGLCVLQTPFTYSLIILNCVNYEQCAQCQEDLARPYALREIPTRRANSSYFGISLFTGVLRHITLCGCGS